MLKKIQPRRKTKRFFNKILFLGIIFFTTLGSLLSVFLFFSLKKHPVLTPLSHTFNQNISTIPVDNTTTILSLLEKDSIAVSHGEVASDSAILITLKTGEQIIFSTKKDLAKQIASLQLIIRQLTIEGRKYSRIDFRYDNPVVMF